MLRAGVPEEEARKVRVVKLGNADCHRSAIANAMNLAFDALEAERPGAGGGGGGGGGGGVQLLRQALPPRQI